MVAVNRTNPIRAKSSDSQYTLVEFMETFPTDAACLEWLWERRFSEDGEHAYCPKCNKIRSFKRYESHQLKVSWTCVACGHHIHPLARTIFEKSSTSLRLWFYAMYLMVSTKCGISAKQLERELGVTYKTAWRMAYLIRNYLMEQTDEPLSGIVEADETYIGGRRRGDKRGRPAQDSHKVPVFGMVQRQGQVRAMTVPNVKRATVFPHLKKHVIPASIVCTDELKSYNGMERIGFNHQSVNHSENVYVSGNVHTNAIEGFWSLTKRGIGGVYHAVSAKHLQGYLNEYAWRY
ncbi:MAG: IS1595 family transposase, partial [Chloroflexi bacterium]|nr:IS1595 family transposase [Chloroflexota bacterium]